MKKKSIWILTIVVIIILLGGGFWFYNHGKNKSANVKTHHQQYSYVVKAASPLELSANVVYQQKYSLNKVNNWQLLVVNGANVYKGEKLDTTGQLAPASGIFELGDKQNFVYTTPFKAQGQVSEYDLNKIAVGNAVTVKSLTDNNKANNKASQSGQITYLQLNSTHQTSGISYYNFEASLPQNYRLGQHVIISIPSPYTQIPKKVVKHHVVQLADKTKRSIRTEQIKQTDHEYYYVDRNYLQPQTKLIYKDK